MVEGVTFQAAMAAGVGAGIGVFCVTVAAIHYCVHNKAWRKIWPQQPVAQAIAADDAEVVKVKASADVESALTIKPASHYQEDVRTSKTLTYSFDCGRIGTSNSDDNDERPVNERRFKMFK